MRYCAFALAVLAVSCGNNPPDPDPQPGSTSGAASSGVEGASSSGADSGCPEGLECYAEPHSGVCEDGACICRSTNDCDPHNLHPCVEHACTEGKCVDAAAVHEGGACFTPAIPKGTCVAGDCVPSAP